MNKQKQTVLTNQTFGYEIDRIDNRESFFKVLLWSERGEINYIKNKLKNTKGIVNKHKFRSVKNI